MPAARTDGSEVSLAEQIVYNFFASRNATLPEEEAERSSCMYLNASLLDSFGVIELIMEVEQKCNVRFTGEDYENPQFKTVGGLIALINEKIG